MTVGTKDSRKPGGGGARYLSKRFYKSVTVAKPQGAGPAYGILLDGKAVRTPAKVLLAVPTESLAEAIAGEWEDQGEHIDPEAMPLTRLVNSVLDGVRGRENEVRAEIVKYAASDLLCYRASEPDALVRRQSELWDPILAWSHDRLGARLAVAEGLMPFTQSEATRSAIAKALEEFDTFMLGALHVMTTLMGSASLALAHAHGRLSAGAAWEAAHVDEDWQISQWGEDAEANARRRQRWIEMLAASRLLALLELPTSGLAHSAPGQRDLTKDD
jgi:chaperone required for assembly of F1-ATPase